MEVTNRYRQLHPTQKATALGSLVHLDYFLFESDLPPVTIKTDHNSCVTIITLFQVGLMCREGWVAVIPHGPPNLTRALRRSICAAAAALCRSASPLGATTRSFVRHNVRCGP